MRQKDTEVSTQRVGEVVRIESNKRHPTDYIFLGNMMMVWMLQGFEQSGWQVAATGALTMSFGLCVMAHMDTETRDKEPELRNGISMLALCACFVAMVGTVLAWGQQ